MLYAIYFIYGLCVMFYFMMSWLFYRKDKEMLSRLVTVLMFVIGLQCLKDLFFIKPITELDEIDWMVVTAAVRFQFSSWLLLPLPPVQAAFSTCS